MPEKNTYAASVKVMRSHDYCHFEVALSTTEPLDLAGVDAMRKEAARLADKAVDQYKIAKEHAATRLRVQDRREWDQAEVQRIRDTPESERTSYEKAELKAWDDATFQAGRSYDYQDDWADDEED